MSTVTHHLKQKLKLDGNGKCCCFTARFMHMPNAAKRKMEQPSNSGPEVVLRPRNLRPASLAASPIEAASI